MLQIVQIVRHLAIGAYDIRRAARRIVIMDLRPAGESRSNQMPHLVLWNFAFVCLRNLGKLGPRTDKGEVASNHIQELRQFINTRFSKQTAERRYSVFLLKLWIAIVIEKHGTELQKPDDTPALANAFRTNEGHARLKEKHERSEGNYWNRDTPYA